MATLVKRLVKGTPLTHAEMDGNFDLLGEKLLGTVTEEDLSIALINAVQNLRDGVPFTGDTLLKLFNLITELKENKINISDIVNDLNQSIADKPLSAMQGKLLKEALDQEINNRVSDNNIGLSIVNENISITNTNLNNEIATRISSINTEINNRINSDNLLDSKINNIITNTDAVALNSLSELVSAFQLADGNLETSLSALTTNAQSSLNQEILNRQNAISLEQNNRQQAITAAINQLRIEIESKMYSI